MVASEAVSLDLSALQALILDIDGVLYEGSKASPGAIGLISQLRKEGTPFLLLSNNTFRSLSGHVRKLADLGIYIKREEILTAAVVTARVIARESGSCARCFVVGEEGLVEAMRDAGLTVVTDDCPDITHVVVGMDRKLTYDKLKVASLAIRRGAIFIASNPDPAYPADDGLIPASGAIQAALEAATGVPARVTGKPEATPFLLALEALGSRPENTAMLGDQVEIDIAGAKRVGLKTILILSSLTPKFEPTSATTRPDAIYPSIEAFFKRWRDRKRLM